MKRLSNYISRFFIVSLICISTSLIYGQSLDSIFRPAGLILAIDYQGTSFFGSHVMNKSFDGWTGTNYSIGISIYDRAEILFTLGIMKGQLVDRKYVDSSAEFVTFSKMRIRAPLLSYSRFTYLNPEIAFGGAHNNFQGKIDGNLIELGNNISFDIRKNMKIVGSVFYQRTKYDIETNAELLPLFDVSSAIVFSLGIQYHSQMTKEAKYIGFRKNPDF